MIQVIEFSETPLRDALEFISQKAVELGYEPFLPFDKSEDRQGHASAIPPITADSSDFGFEGEGKCAPAQPSSFGVGEMPVTLQLYEISAWDALQKTAGTAGLKASIENGVIVVLPGPNHAQLYEQQKEIWEADLQNREENVMRETVAPIDRLDQIQRIT